MLNLAFDHGYAQVEQFLNLGRDLRKHGQHSADMEAANPDLHSGAPKLPRQICRAGKLIGLHAHEHYRCFNVRRAAGAADAPDRYALHAIVEKMSLDSDIPQCAPGHAVCGQRVESDQCVAGEHTAPIADDIAVVVIFGWLYQVEL